MIIWLDQAVVDTGIIVVDLGHCWLGGDEGRKGGKDKSKEREKWGGKRVGEGETGEEVKAKGTAGERRGKRMGGKGELTNRLFRKIVIRLIISTLCTNRDGRTDGQN